MDKARVAGFGADALEVHSVAKHGSRISGLRFDWLMVLMCSVFVAGLYLDGWAHNHGRVDQSFFTLWHAFFYSGYLLVVITLAAATLANRARGLPLSLSVPHGYRLTGVGLFVFAAGGVGDMAWHQMFGVERGIEALFSPTHIVLGVGIGLIVTGPLRAAWGRPGREATWRTHGAGIASLGLFMAGFTFFMMFFFPITVLLGTPGADTGYFDDDIGRAGGLVGATLSASVLVGPALLCLRRWRLPFGAVTGVLALSIAGATVVNYEEPLMIWLSIGMLAPSVVVDYLAWRARPDSNPATVRWLSPALPLLLYGGYYAVLLPLEGTTWSVHMWTSTIVVPALACWLLSFLLYPPSLQGRRT